MKPLPTVLTLLIALCGPPLLAMLGPRVLAGSTSLPRMLSLDLVLWAIFALVLTVVVRVDKQPLASIGLRRPRWQTLGWALLLFVGINLMLAPATMAVVRRLGFPGYEAGLLPLLRLPVGYRLFVAVSAGIIEEVLYRGYAVERLSWLFGSTWLGASIAVIASSLAHLPSWGVGPALVFLVDAAAATLFYVWKRDLAALMLAHAVGDSFGLVVFPPFTPR